MIFHTGPLEDLQRAAPPAGLLPDAILKDCGLQFSAQVSLPDICPGNIEDCGEDEYFKLLRYLGAFSTHHQVLGHESPIQGDMKLECQLVSNGLYCGNASGFNDPRAEGLRVGAGDWMLLLQVDSDDNANMMWGDAGRLYFWIRKQDLSEGLFDKVWMILQCS